MQIDPKNPVMPRETEPSRDAADFMMDAIAVHFARSHDLPAPARGPERRRRLVWLLLISAVGLLIFAGAIAYVRSHFVVLPDYTGARESQARSDLVIAGLVVTMRSQSSIMVRAHHVIEQSPPAGQWLSKGATVVLTTSTGLPRVAAAHQRSATIPKAHAPAVASTTPHILAAAPHILATAPRTASTPAAKSPSTIAANTPFGVRSVGAVRVFSSASCAGENLAVEIQGLSNGCTAFAIASTGELLHGAGNGLVVPVTSIAHPGEVKYGLMYVTPPGASRRFFGILYGNSTGHLIVSVHDGLFEAQNGSHARFVTVGAVEPAPAAIASHSREGPKTNCPQRSWLQKTVKNVFAPHSAACR